MFLSRAEKTSLSDLMSEVKGRDEDHPGSLSSERAHAFTHWLLRYPLQCVIIAEEITWEREISGAIKQQNLASLNSERRVAPPSALPHTENCWSPKMYLWLRKTRWCGA